MTLHCGDCREVMAAMEAASVDAVVTDPPYELGFMGRSWDASGVAYDPAVWRECLRVLKPGGHLLAFGGTRTYHRLACAVEDAGFEIRDSIGNASAVLAWCYGSGFPKSLNVSKDRAFCQCLPSVRDAATNEAAESAARVLLNDLRGAGEADSAGIEDLHGVPVGFHPGYAVPSGAEQDVLSGVQPNLAGAESRSAATSISDTHSNAAVRSVRDIGDPVSEPGAAVGPGVLLAEVPRTGERGDTAGECLRRDGDEAEAALRAGQPGVEGRGDLQAPEGQLRGSALRPLPTGSAGNGQVGRLHHGAPAGDGPVDRPAATASGVREPQGPQPPAQRPAKPGAVSDERGSQAGRGWPACGRCGKPALPPGLGTALKPAWEPIVLARKPLAGTVAANVLEHGTGALNIDGCRVGSDTTRGERYNGKPPGGSHGDGLTGGPRAEPWTVVAGRWPPNVLLGPEAAAELDAQAGDVSYNPAGKFADARIGPSKNKIYGARDAADVFGYGDHGGPSRFFPVFRYQAKAPRGERPRLPDGTTWPTVKPLGLMRWLVRLVTPPGGRVLDPFAGTGTTGEACALEGFDCVLIEQDPKAVELARIRLGKPVQPVMGV